MTVVRRRLFWKIYLTLLASLVVAVALTGAFVWFLGEAFREGAPQVDMGPRDVSVYSAAGALTQSRGRPIGFGDVAAGHHWGPGHVLRIGLPDGNILLARFGPPSHGKRIRVLAAVLRAIALAVGLAAYPVTTLLTRRLERLRAGVARWGTRQAARLDDRGHDEVALLAATFNAAAARLDALLASQKALLANASHELRSPLARLRVAVEVADAGDTRRDEIARNLAEMDVLVDELLLSSRLDHPEMRDDRREPIDLLGLAAEEASRVDAVVEGEPVEIAGDPVLLRRLIRNLLENGGKHGAPPVTIEVSREGDGAVVRVSDAGAGIASGDRERIFEPFYRPAGSGEGAGGWGLGLALVRQIAIRHGGTATCEATPSGSCFVVRLRG